jgi:hypothetical protein
MTNSIRDGTPKPVGYGCDMLRGTRHTGPYPSANISPRASLLATRRTHLTREHRSPHPRFGSNTPPSSRRGGVVTISLFPCGLLNPPTDLLPTIPSCTWLADPPVQHHFRGRVRHEVQPHGRMLVLLE